MVKINTRNPNKKQYRNSRNFKIEFQFINCRLRTKQQPLWWAWIGEFEISMSTSSLSSSSSWSTCSSSSGSSSSSSSSESCASAGDWASSEADIILAAANGWLGLRRRRVAEKWGVVFQWSPLGQLRYVFSVGHFFTNIESYVNTLILNNIYLDFYNRYNSLFFSFFLFL